MATDPGAGLENGPSSAAIREANRARRFLLACTATLPGVEKIYSRGYTWVRDKFLPAILILDKQPDFDRNLLANAWDMLSAVHSINLGYGPAVRASKRAVELAPASTLIAVNHAELCVSAGSNNDKEEALSHLQTFPDHESLMADVATLAEDEDAPREYAEVANALSQFSPEKALELLRHRRSQLSRTWKARACGALSRGPQAMHHWTSMVQHPQNIRLLPPDWFYLCDETWDDPRFWLLLLNALPRLTRSWVPLHSSLEEITGSDHAEDWRMQLLFEFHVARTTGDHAKMRDLHRKHPAWKEAALW